MKYTRRIVIIIAAVGVATVVGIIMWLDPFLIGQNGSVASISSFDECVRAGYPVMESFPRQCRTADGRNFTEQESGISGMVLLGPTCPVISDPPDPECADKPYATALVVTTSDQTSVIKAFRSDETGRFSVQVAPGEYSIRSEAASNVLPFCSSNGNIKVNINAHTETTVSCDTGIR